MRDDAEEFTQDASCTRHERELAMDVDEAWELIGTSDGLAQWLGDDVDLEVEPGSTGTVRDGDEVLLTKVESVEPGRRVSLRWWSEDRGASVVDLTVEPVSDRASRLVVVEIPVDAIRLPAFAPASWQGSAGGPQMIAGGAAGALALA